MMPKDIQNIKTPGKRLCELLGKLRADPKIASELPICRPENLRKLWPHDYEEIVLIDTGYIAQVTTVLQYITLKELGRALAADNTILARGLILFWYTYFDPVSRDRVTPPLKGVVAYFVNNVNSFVSVAQRMMNRSKYFVADPNFKDQVVKYFVIEQFRKLFGELYTGANGGLLTEGQFAKILDKGRRSWANHLETASEALANLINDSSPTVLAEGDGIQPIIANLDIEHVVPSVKEDPGDPPTSSPDAAEDKDARPERSVIPVKGQDRTSRTDDETHSDTWTERLDTGPVEPEPKRRLRDWLDRIAVYVKYRCSSHASCAGLSSPIFCRVGRKFDIVAPGGSTLLLDDIIKAPASLTGKAVLISGVPGSGRTAELRWAAYCAAQAWLASDSDDALLPFYFSAPEYAVAAESQMSIFDYIVDNVFDDLDEDDRAMVTSELNRLNRARRLFLVMDDLDRLERPRREFVIRRMTYSPVTMSAVVPWDIPVFQKLLPPEREVAILAIQDLDAASRRSMLNLLAQHHVNSAFDQVLGNYAINESPFLTALPLGVVVLFVQMLENKTTRREITRRALNEMLRRAEHEEFKYDNWLGSSPMIQSLLQMARLTATHLNAIELRASATDTSFLSISRRRYESSIDQGWRCKWDLLQPTRLFTLVEDAREEALVFCNLDIFCFLMAHLGRIHTRASHDNSNEHNWLPDQLVNQIDAYWDEEWESKSLAG